jgi:hypothetical protein
MVAASLWSPLPRNPWMQTDSVPLTDEASSKKLSRIGLVGMACAAGSPMFAAGGRGSKGELLIVTAEIIIWVGVLLYGYDWMMARSEPAQCEVVIICCCTVSLVVIFISNQAPIVVTPAGR